MGIARTARMNFNNSLAFLKSVHHIVYHKTDLELVGITFLQNQLEKIASSKNRALNYRDVARNHQYNLC